MVQYTHDFLLALLLTVSTETVLVLFLLQKVYKQKGVPVKKIVSAGIYANAFTIPYVWFVFPFVFAQPTAIILSELFALIGEAIFYKIFLKLSLQRAFIISLIANLASYALGRVLYL